MVGHTHEDIDQLFSCVSSYLRRNSAYRYTLEGMSYTIKFKCINVVKYPIHLDLKQGILSSDHQLQEVSEIDQVFDAKAWIKPQIDTPRGHTNPHNFLFRMGENGKAEMLYRNWSSDEWIPRAPERGLQLLKVSIDCIPGIINAIPYQEFTNMYPAL